MKYEFDAFEGTDEAIAAAREDAREDRREMCVVKAADGSGRWVIRRSYPHQDHNYLPRFHVEATGKLTEYRKGGRVIDHPTPSVTPMEALKDITDAKLTELGYHRLLGALAVHAPAQVRLALDSLRRSEHWATSTRSKG